MAYSREDIPGMIDALLAARALIAARERNFICSAIYAAETRGHISGGTGLRVRAMIADALGGPYCFLEDWTGIEIPTESGARKIRLKWIDKMVRDLKEYAK